MTFPVLRNGPREWDGVEDDLDCTEREAARTEVENIGDDMQNHVSLTNKKTDYTTGAILSTMLLPIALDLITTCLQKGMRGAELAREAYCHPHKILVKSSVLCGAAIVILLCRC